MSKGSNTLLIIVAAFVAYQLIKQSERAEGEAGTTTTIFGGGGGMGDVSGLFQGIGDMLSGLVGGLGDMFSNLPEAVGDFAGGEGGFDTNEFVSNITDFFKNFPGLSNVPGGNGEAEAIGGGMGEGGGGVDQVSMPNTIPNILNALSNSVDSLAKGLLIGAGTYVGVKAITPTLPAISGVVKSGVTGVGKPLVDLTVGTTRAVTGGISTGISTVGSWLTMPVTKVPILGTAALSGAAFGAGWGIGELFNISPPGQALQRWSGEQGRKAAHWDNWISNWLFPHAKPIELSVPQQSRYERFWGFTYEQAKGWSTAELQAAMARARQRPGFGSRTREITLLPKSYLQQHIPGTKSGPPATPTIPHDYLRAVMTPPPR